VLDVSKFRHFASFRWIGLARMTQHNEDAAWATAWAWVQREHDRERFSDDARARMMEWLAADPAHRRGCGCWQGWCRR